ncbi:MAG: CoA transferase [Hyphomicrobiales bacterium]|nr:CoA transferase [Hyphomicrobiales bacterium]
MAGVFDGLKVVDFTWAAAGPIITKQLADNGATVIKVESRRHPDSIRLGGPFIADKPGINRSGFFADFNSSKLGIALDLARKDAIQIVEPLVRWADIVAESFRPGIMQQWGIGYETLREINPRVVMLSSSLYGADGPWARHPGYGAQGAALSGLHALTGWPDRPPAIPKGAYSDSVSPRFGAAALVAALIHREKTGEGQHIELSQIETTAQLVAPQLLQLQHDGVEAQRAGNRKTDSILHGVYPCSGNERWIAIEIETEPQWRSLLDVLNDSNLSEARRQSIDALDTAVAIATRRRDAFALMSELRTVGVPAGVAFTGSDLLEDPVLRARGHFWPLEHSEMGTLAYNGPAYRFEATPSRLTRPAPLLGEHTDEVLKDVLGFSDDEIARFHASGLLQ